jgi:hypothetical protein
MYTLCPILQIWYMKPLLCDMLLLLWSSLFHVSCTTAATATVAGTAVAVSGAAATIAAVATATAAAATAAAAVTAAAIATVLLVTLTVLNSSSSSPLQQSSSKLFTVGQCQSAGVSPLPLTAVRSAPALISRHSTAAGWPCLAAM